MSRARRASGGIRDMFPVGRGAVLGLIAYVFGYVVTYLFVVLSTEPRFRDGSFELLNIGRTDIVGWMFYNTHFVNVKATAEAAGQSRSESTNMLAEATGLAIPEPFWYVIPVFFLIAAGFIVAMTINGTHSTGKAASAGAMVFVGYLPLSIAGLFVFTSSFSFLGTSVSVGPDKVLGILLAGIVFPLVLGAFGGVLASLTATGSSSGSRAAPDRMT